MKNLKVVVVTKYDYEPKHDSLLASLLDQNYEIVCFVGNDCEKWEEVLDELAIGDGSNPKLITTTCHPEESVDEVMNMVKHMNTSVLSEVDVIRL